MVEDDVYLGRQVLTHVWVQGMITDLRLDVREFSIDDGTDSILVTCSNPHVNLDQLELGCYVMIQGSVVVGEDPDTGKLVVLLDARLVNLLTDPNLESLWQLEVIDAMRIRAK